MDCPHAYQPRLDETGQFWKGVQAACFQAFSKVHWNLGKSQWYSQTCKFHLFQTLLKSAVSEWEKNPEFLTSMKRGLKTEHTELYVFSTNADLNYKLTPEERGFLRAIHLEDFVTAVSWGVLHPQLVKETIVSFEPTTLMTTVKGESMTIIAKNWRKQFEQVFFLTPRKEQPVTKTWTLAELFPSVEEKAGKHDSVRITDCLYPGAKRPLRLLSSLLGLNPTHQHHIAISLAKHILEALNGETVDWPQELYYEITKELLALRDKHRASRVKIGKTSIGPHITLILKEAGILNIREELEAGYRTSKAFTIAEHVPQPKRKKAQAVKRPQPKAKELEAAEEPGSAKAPTAQVYIAMPQVEETGEALPKKGMLLEVTEPSPPPKSLPPMIEQICQAHRHLENLLISFTTKAPSNFVNQINAEFFKVQTEAIL